MKTIGLFSTTRADFGLLEPLIRRISTSDDFTYLLFIGGTHLKEEHGNTIDYIRNKGYNISGTFDYLSGEDTSYGLTKDSGKICSLTADIYKNHNFDFVCILGDRFELLPIVQGAILFRKPIIHIHGGEITMGALDEQVRHMISKAAHIHFASCKEYADNIMFMGEESWRIFNTGALAVENFQGIEKLNRIEVFEELGLDADAKTALLTYHPLTQINDSSDSLVFTNILKALDSFKGQVVISSPNADKGRKQIQEAINRLKNNRKFHLYKSLGSEKYLCLLKYASLVIGNSSSGLIEAPWFKTPTLNVGERQAGRIRHKSIIDSDGDIESIEAGIDKALNVDFLASLDEMEYKFGDGTASIQMIKALRLVCERQDLLLKKLTKPC